MTSEEESEGDADWDDVIEKIQAEREADIDRTTFEYCSLIRDAGERYREGRGVESIADDLGVSKDRAREAIGTYIAVFANGGDEKLHGREAGIRYFRDGEDPTDLVKRPFIDGEEQAIEQVRAFIGGILRTTTLDEVDITEGIPDYSELRTPAEKLADMMPSVLRSISSQVTDAFAPLREIQSQVGPIQEAVQRIAVPQVHGLVEQLQSQLQGIVEPLQKLQEQYSDSIRYGITNFEPPNEYDPAQVQIDPTAKEVGVANLERFIEQMEAGDNDDFKAYAGRLRTALEAYKTGESLLPTYVFISTQDGFLGYLCDELEVAPEATYYKKSHKERAFQDAYPGFFGVETEEVVPTWSKFWKHRNAIMHGDPNAHIDENIATIALLFLGLTVYSAMEMEEQDTENNGASA